MDKEKEIYSNVLRALSAVKTVDAAQINGNTRLIADVGLESIDVIDFIFELEKLSKSEVSLIDLFQSTTFKSENGYADLTVKDIVATLLHPPV